MMRTLLFLIALSIGATSAQAQTVIIEAGGGPSPAPLPYYLPQHVTINVGDTVRWIQVQGQHNVDGSLATFPNNPEGFRNGPPATGNWVFDKIFTIPGVYDFECEQGMHNQWQFGTVTVLSTQSINEYSKINIDVYPNPANDFLRIKTAEKLTKLSLYTLDMKKVSDLEVELINSEYEVSISDVGTGIYLLQCEFDGAVAHKKIVVN